MKKYIGCNLSLGQFSWEAVLLGANRPRGNYEDDKTSERPFLFFLSMGKLSVGNYLRGNRLRNNYLGGNFTVSIIQGAIFCVGVCVSMCVCVFGGGEDGVQLSGGQISSGSIILGVNCPRGNISGANHPGGGNCPSGNYPGGNFPREKMSRLRHGRIVKKDWQLISLFKNICHLVIMLTL